MGVKYTKKSLETIKGGKEIPKGGNGRVGYPEEGKRHGADECMGRQKGERVRRNKRT